MNVYNIQLEVSGILVWLEGIEACNVEAATAMAILLTGDDSAKYKDHKEYARGNYR